MKEDNCFIDFFWVGWVGCNLPDQFVPNSSSQLFLNPPDQLFWRNHFSQTFQNLPPSFLCPLYHWLQNIPFILPFRLFQLPISMVPNRLKCLRSVSLLPNPILFLNGRLSRGLPRKFFNLIRINTQLKQSSLIIFRIQQFDIVVCTSLVNNVRNASTTYSRTIKRKTGN